MKASTLRLLTLAIAIAIGLPACGKDDAATDAKATAADTDTGGSANSTDSGEIGVLLNGSNTAPPPIAQLYLSRTGVFHVVASGLCFHALTGWGGETDRERTTQAGFDAHLTKPATVEAIEQVLRTMT